MNSFLLELILEWLPVSSSGNIFFYSVLFPSFIPLTSFANHCGHMLIAPFQLIIFLIVFLKKKRNLKDLIQLGCGGVIMTAITAIFYLFFNFCIDHFIKNKVFFFLPFGFFFTTLMLVYLRQATEGNKDISNFCLSDYVMLGAVQGVSLLPGVSRLGIVLAASRMLSYSRVSSLLISFVSNMAISGGSILYLLVVYFHYESSEFFSFMFSSWVLCALCLGFIFGIVWVWMYLKNDFNILIWYEFLIGLFSFYILFFR